MHVVQAALLPSAPHGEGQAGHEAEQVSEHGGKLSAVEGEAGQLLGSLEVAPLAVVQTHEALPVEQAREVVGHHQVIRCEIALGLQRETHPMLESEVMDKVQSREAQHAPGCVLQPCSHDPVC